MNLILEINNLAGCNFDEKRLKLAVAETIEKSERANFFKKDVSLSIALVSAKEIKKINKKYRDKNYPTDILSFGNFEKVEELIAAGGENIFLGELIICYEDIEKYCQEENISLDSEFFKVISHGVLHLLGFDHGKQMFTLQKEVSRIVCS